MPHNLLTLAGLNGAVFIPQYYASRMLLLHLQIHKLRRQVAIGHLSPIKFH